MDILTTFLQFRQQASLLGDYSQYRNYCTRRLEKLRKRLGVANSRKGKNAKYVARPGTTAEEVGRVPQLAHLLILASEKAWADAQYMKSLKEADASALDASAKKYIKSRFHKSSVRANELRALLSDPASNASERDTLEAALFAFQAQGAESMEKHAWAKGLPAFAAARLILLTFDEKKHKEFLTGVVEPSLRFSAYNLGISRSVELDKIMLEHFPKEDTAVVELIKKINPEAFDENMGVAEKGGVNAVREVEWRGRKAPVEIADVATALGSVKTAETDLEKYLAEHTSLSGKDQAAAFDGILAAWQDAQDAVKAAIADLQSEKVGAADPRLQALHITFTYVSYNLIGWRIARDRTMSEGIVENAKGGKLSGLKELVALYDAILRSIEQIIQLPGVAMDRAFMSEMSAKKGYFQAQKCLAIAKSHALLSAHRPALALLSRASSLLPSPSTPLPASTRGLSITPTDISTLQSRLGTEILRFRALSEIEKISAQQKPTAAQTSVPLIDRVDVFSEGDVDVGNVVRLPVVVEPVPVKPIFFDVAWNYVGYPGAKQAVQAVGEKKEEGKKKGLFGLFGR